MTDTAANHTDFIAQVLDTLVNRIDLTHEQTRQLFLLIMQGKLDDANFAAILVALRMKSESIEEITAAASVMRELATTVDISGCDHQVDIVGTGGDGANLFNVSTASAMVAAAAGCTVAKHGNGGVSSRSGSSDMLAEAGVQMALTIEQTKRCIETLGIGFLFAPNHHKAMKHAITVRRAIKIRTIFNQLGPLANPANVPNLVIGVFTQRLCEPLAKVMQNLGANHVMVVHSDDGLDEISLASTTTVAELKDGKVSIWQLTPEDVGITSRSLHGLSIESPSQSLSLIRQALKKGDYNEDVSNEPVAKAMDMIALNAGAAIYVSGVTNSYAAGVHLAQDILVGGQGLEKFNNLVEFTQTLVTDN